MKTTLSTSILCLLLNTIGFTQDIPLENWCMTAHKHNELLKDPAYQKMMEEMKEIRQKEVNQASYAPKGTVFQIPIVFHILHNGGDENISEEQIMNGLYVLNRDFRAQNPDTATVVAQFKPIIADVEIEFILATQAPNGECFRGYTRTKSPLTFQGNDGWAQVDAVRNGNDVYQGNWPSNMYLNVYIIADAGGAGGYTYYPNNNNNYDMTNGIWLLHTQFSEIGTSGTGAGRSLTHECGHWLNLPHTWGSTNSPGLPGNCGSDDGIGDTPNCLGVLGGCPLSDNGCGPLANVQNYMDYALSCQSMFTLGQRTEMRTAVQSTIGGRNNLWTAGNLVATGADINAGICEADFTSDKSGVCVGESIQFEDVSYHNITGWNWTFEGGNPASSTDQNPVVTYAAPGVYQVTLLATDALGGTDTKTITDYVHVHDLPEQLPFIESFESFSTFNGISEWQVYNPDNNAAFELSTSAGHTGTKSAALMNFGQGSNYTDELIAAPVDLSGVDLGTTALTLSFRYAYRKRSSANDEWLRVFISNDCGDSWSLRKTIHGNALSPNVSSTSWTPSSSNEWVTVHVPNITSAYLIENFKYKFSFVSDNGNNLYLDNINIYADSPSDDLVIGLDETESIQQLQLYPNPTEGILNVSFETTYNQHIQFAITDVMGRVIQTTMVQAPSGKNLLTLDTGNMSAGIYFLELRTHAGRKVFQFEVK